MVNSAVFAAADVSTLGTSVSTMAVALVGVMLIGVGYAYVRKYLPGKK